MRREVGGLVETLPLVCQQCREPACVPACPAEALTRTEGGILAVDSDACTGCGECIEACPAGCIFLDAKGGTALACDLCGGEPRCVSFCHALCLNVDDDAGGSGEMRVARLAEIKDAVFSKPTKVVAGGR
jgi:Fe-S-cluster-containing dehydrogenase component